MASPVSISSKLIAETIALGLSPLLKKLGFRKQGLHFFHSSDAATCHLDIQASQWSAPDCASFTVNLWSYLPAIAVVKGEEPIAEPLKQKLRAHCGIRIGHLLPKPEDFWWRIQYPSDVPKVAADLASTIEKYGIPYLDRIATLTGVAELSGYIPTIGNNPTEPKAIALRLLGRWQEASDVEASLRAQADAGHQRLQNLLSKRAAEAFFQQLAALSSREKAETVLKKARKVPPIAGDELLEKS
jgi:Domain of unknown function (DUF4304)